MASPIATYYGRIIDDSLYFYLNVNGNWIANMVLDTGAFELTFSGSVAASLGLLNLGPVYIEGVGGTVQAYASQCNLSIGPNTYLNVPCIVDPSLAIPGLFGLRFLVDNQLLLVLDPTTQTFTLMQP